MARTLSLILFLISCPKLWSQVGIGTGTDPIHVSAELEVRSLDKGVLIPRIGNPANVTDPTDGLLIYNTTDNVFYYYNGGSSSWMPANFLSRSKLFDADGNTGVDVDFTGDGTDNKIHFYADADNNDAVDGAADEVATVTAEGIDVLNNNDYYAIDGTKVLSGKGTNVYLGAGAGNLNAVADNAFVGANAGAVNQADGNTFVGANAGAMTVSGSQNIAIGADALDENVTGSDNIAIGSSAGGVVNASGNVMIGALAAQNLTSGSNNVAIGYNAAGNQTAGSNTVVIGANTNLPVADQSNVINIDGVIYVDNGVVNFNQAYSFPTTASATDIGKTLTLDGAGHLIWDDVQSAASTDALTIGGAAADMQPFSMQLGDLSVIGNKTVYFNTVKAFCNAEVTRLTTYISENINAATVHLGLYLHDGTDFKLMMYDSTNTLYTGGSVSIVAGFSGYVTLEFPKGTGVKAGQNYYIGVYSTDGSTKFLARQNNISKTYNYAAGDIASLPLSRSAPLPIVGEDKVIWVRSY